MTERVLVAEDDAIIRFDLKEMLTEEGYEVIEASDGAAAVELARREHPNLCIFDIKMPLLDGIAAAKQVNDEGIAPVVILTAYAQRDLVQQASEAGAMAYLLKPFQKADLLPAIEIAKGRYRQIAALTEEVGDLAERLEARKLVDRAKGLLMDRFGLAESDAFHFLQRSAMARRVPMAAIARAILDGTLTPD